MSVVLDRCAPLARGSPCYPASLVEKLGGGAPAALTLCGSAAALSRPLVALFCSRRVPGDALVAAYDLARALRDAGHAVIGGFHTPVERECLELVLRGSAPVVVVLPRAIEGMRCPPGWGAPLREGRLLVVSPFPGGRRRASVAQASTRNRVIAALAARLVVVHATPGGEVHRRVGEALGWGVPVACLDHPENRELAVMGAEPIPIGGPRTAVMDYVLRTTPTIQTDARGRS